jgi:hypothetical protein
MPAAVLEETKTGQVTEPEGDVTAGSDTPEGSGKVADSGPPTVEEILAQVAQKGGTPTEKPATPAPATDAEPAGKDDAADVEAAEEEIETEIPDTTEPTDEEMPADLLARAAQYGMSPEDCADLGSVAGVERAMSLIHRTWLSAQNQQRIQPQAEQKKPPEPDAVDLILDEIEKSGIDEGHAANLKKLIKTLQSTMGVKIGQLEQTVTNLNGRDQERVHEEFTRDCDRGFRELEKEMPGFVGKGNFWQMTDAKMIGKRQDIATHAVALMNVQKAPRSQINKYLRIAAEALYPEERQEYRKKQAMREVTKERQQTIPTPQHRQPGATTTDPFKASVAQAKEIALKYGHKS